MFKLFSVPVWLAPAANKSGNAWGDTWVTLDNSVNKNLADFCETFMTTYNQKKKYSIIDGVT